MNLPFPLALSFVTFQMIAFLVDYYDGYVKKINIKDFFLFIIFFPQLIAGPIVRYNDMVVQYKSSKNKKININNIFVGLILIIIGFLKKTVLADNLGVFVDSSYIDTTNLSFYLGWLTSIAFTFQIYFDFSGYVDMATGSALLFNIKLPQNFDSPFKAKSLINFWQRWHMTLTSFLTNYIFNPCVRSLKEVTFIKMMFLIIMVFIICGFWHGPSWMYGIFGLMHGLGLAINHTFNKFFKIELNGVFSWFLTFNFVNFTFIFFRSKNLEQSFDMIKAMFDFNLAKLNYIILADFQKFILLISISFVLVLCFKNSYRLFDNYLKIKNNTDDYI
ncbi:MBOAT family protein [Candidatus Pelagibacter sp.]|nr:MBOAT family protein [Candidatus Pelagibacter sp.]